MYLCVKNKSQPKGYTIMKMTAEALRQKVGQFFFPAVFINDTEENIQ